MLAPEARPTALEWLGALFKAVDMLRPCAGSECPRRWFVVTGPGPHTCPYCGMAAAGLAPILALLDEVRGSLVVSRRMVIHKGLTIHRWHAEAGVPQGPAVDARPLARVRPHGGRWRLVNLASGSLARADGTSIRVGGSMTLKEAMVFRLSNGPNGRLARVEYS